MDKVMRILDAFFIIKEIYVPIFVLLFILLRLFALSAYLDGNILVLDKRKWTEV